MKQCTVPTIEWDLDYHNRIPYAAEHSTPVHRWFLIKESQSLAQMQDVFNELGVTAGDLVIDPFCGSGTVALQCGLVGAHFLGVDQLATCVIATRAKLLAPRVDSVSLASVAGLISERAAHDANPFTVVGIAHLAAIQSLILKQCAPSTTWVLLTTLQSTAAQFGIGEDGATSLTSLLKLWVEKVRLAAEDICNVKAYGRSEAIQNVMWGSGLAWNWARAVRAIQPKQVFLVTSPPFPRSAQDRSTGALAREALARQVLAESSEQMYCGTDVQSNGNGEDAYLKLVDAILERLTTLNYPIGGAVIECECLVKTVAEEMLDSKICTMAARRGFNQGRIRVTHFLKAAGVSTNHFTDVRGSLIYLKPRE